MATRRPDSIEEFQRKQREKNASTTAADADDYNETLAARLRATAQADTPAGERHKQNILDRSLEAQRRIKSGQTWTDWEAIAEAVRVITADVMAATGTDSIQADAFKKAFGKAWREHESLVSNEKDYRSLTRQEVHDLRFLLEHPEVAAWRAKLKPQQQRHILHPRTAIGRWKAAMKREQTAGQPRPPVGTRTSEPVTKPASPDSAALAKKLAQAEARIAELEARGERPQAGADAARLEAEVAELRDENSAFRVELAARNHVIKTRDGGGLTNAQFRKFEMWKRRQHTIQEAKKAKAKRRDHQPKPPKEARKLRDK